MGRELKLVPLDFKYPIGQIWIGQVNPYPGIPCKACDETGMNNETLYLLNTWYPNRITGEPGWCNSLTQVEVDALVSHNRLWDFTRIPLNKEQQKIVDDKIANGGNSWLPFDNGYIPTADEVNEWNKNSMFGHDAINRFICVEARAKSLGVYGKCEYCNGEGTIFHNEELKRLHDEFEYYNPPMGAGYILWSNTSDSIESPVFASVEELAVWCCENYATTFAYDTLSKDEWIEYLPKSFFGNNPNFKIGFF